MGMDEFEGANIQAYGVAAAPQKPGERPAEAHRPRDPNAAAAAARPASTGQRPPAAAPHSGGGSAPSAHRHPPAQHSSHHSGSHRERWGPSHTLVLALGYAQGTSGRYAVGAVSHWHKGIQVDMQSSLYSSLQRG
jgi:hypothetical protein